jgi:mitochondrial import inner membrane translocase subunit TIM23
VEICERKKLPKRGERGCVVFRSAEESRDFEKHTIVSRSSGRDLESHARARSRSTQIFFGEPFKLGDDNTSRRPLDVGQRLRPSQHKKRGAHHIAAAVMSSLWNALTGGKASQQSTTAPQPPAQATSQDNFHPTPFDPSSAQGVDVFLKSSAFADPSQLHPLSGLNKETLEYLTLEDSALSDLPGGQSVLPSRGFTDDLCYGTGITYLAALSLGGAWGLQEGLRRSAGQPPKLRLNSVLNAVTRRGPFLGNSAGVVAIVYNCFNSLIGYYRGKNDAANTIAAGFLSGMLFKSTRGVKPMIISGGVVASVAGVWAVCLPWMCISSTATNGVQVIRRTLFAIPEPSKQHEHAVAI